MRRKGSLLFNGYLTISILLNAIVAFGQSVEMDTSFRPPRYEVEVAQFRAFVQTEEDVILIGNSITSYIDWSELIADARIKNRGIAGDNSFGIKQRIADLTTGNPAKIFLMTGINDLARGYSIEMILANFDGIVKEIKTNSPQTKIFLQSVLPTNVSFPKAAQHYDKNAEILQLNSALKVLCSRHEIRYVDLHSLFSDSDGQLRREFTYDGVHLTIAGYLKWADVIRPMIDLP